MRKMLFAAALAAACFAGCTKSDSKADKAAAGETETAGAKLPMLSVDEVDQHIAKGASQAVDANGDSTRKRLGVVPGAVLLTDSDSFALSELPADKAKELVFYCANTQCSASHHAAQRALTAGYTNVKVMPAGIAGWVDAGKKTQKI